MLALWYVVVGLAQWTGASISSSPWMPVDPTADPDYESLLPVEFMPKILTTDETSVFTQGENVTFHCEVIELGKYSLIWQKGIAILLVLQKGAEGFDVQYVTKNPRIKHVNTSLIIQDVKEEDEGDYSCMISPDSDQTVHYFLMVNVPPSIQPKEGTDFISSHQGKDVTIECEVTAGKPRPRVTWEKEEGSENLTFSHTKLSLTDLRPSDSGVYVCIANNGVGLPGSASIALHVDYPPIVSIPIKVVHSGVNYDAILWCIAEAPPFPKVEWYKEGNPVNPMRLHKGIEKENRYSLFFERVFREDFGFYSCNATNFWGNASGVVELSGRPATPRIISHPQGAFTNNYTLMWEVKSYAPIISYSLLLKNASSLEYEEVEWANITVPGNLSPSMYHGQKYTMNDLLPGASLAAKVRAENEFGESEFSDFFMFQTSAEKDEEVVEEVPKVVTTQPHSEIADIKVVKHHIGIDESHTTLSNDANSLLIQANDMGDIRRVDSSSVGAAIAWSMRLTSLTSFLGLIIR